MVRIVEELVHAAASVASYSSPYEHSSSSSPTCFTTHSVGSRNGSRLSGLVAGTLSKDGSVVLPSSPICNKSLCGIWLMLKQRLPPRYLSLPSRDNSARAKEQRPMPYPVVNLPSQRPLGLPSTLSRGMVSSLTKRSDVHIAESP